MERLTFDGNFCEIAQCRELPCQNGDSCSPRKVWERLKEYEDTGLKPDEIECIMRMVTGETVAEASEFAGLPVARLKELAEADKDGRVIVTDAPSADERDGLRQKYRVYKAKDNTPVDGCFALRPEKDPAARIALEAYAKATDNKALSEEILAALGDSGRVMVLPCKVGKSMLDMSDIVQPSIMKRIRPAVAYDSRGIVFYQPYGIFLENVAKGYIQPLSEEAEAKLKEVQKDG